MPKKSTPSRTPQSPGVESRQEAWEQSTSMASIEHEVLLAEAEQRQALMQSLSSVAQHAGLDLKAMTARRAAAFKKVIASLKPFLDGPKDAKQ